MNFTAQSLPIVGRSAGENPHTEGTQGLPRVQWIERKGAALHAIPMSDQDEVLGWNIARGCIHRCAFCSARAYPNYPGDDVLQVYRNSAEQLDEELRTRRRRPRAVYISPSTDPFPPLNEVQAEVAEVVSVLARHGVEAWLLTRGYIRPALQVELARHRQWVRVTVGLTTLDRNLQRMLEPLAASPRLRLHLLAQLQKLGIRTQVALDPLIPGLTDTRDSVRSVLQAAAARKIRHASASYMFLRPGIEENLRKALEPQEWDSEVLSAFDGGPMLIAPGMAAARYLPKVRRQHGYAMIMALAAELEMRVTVNATTNPDFAASRRLEPTLFNQSLYGLLASR